MRILQFNNYADPVGGAEVYALALTEALQRRGHEVAFFGTAPDREVHDPKLRVVRRPRYDPALLMKDALVREELGGFLSEFHPEVVHVHNVHALGLDVLDALRLVGAPILQTVHDFSLLCPNSWCVRGDGSTCPGGAGEQCFQHDCQKNYPFDPEVALTTLLKHRSLSGIVDLAVCPSRALAERMQASGFPNVCHRNYFIEPISMDASSSPREDHSLLYIGRLEPEKGVGCLLEAMPKILAAESRASLSIVGGGSQAAPLEARANELGLGQRVRFMSHVPRAELGSFYARSALCILPSIWSENSPLVAYECLFAGLPMIGSRVGGIPELVEEGRAGFTFTPRDPADLARAVLRFFALAPSERDAMSQRMRARAEEFRLGPHLAWLEEQYAQLLEQGARTRACRVAIDSDLLALLEQFGQERARLGRLFHEHLGYIRHLESTLGQTSKDASNAVPPAQGLLKRLTDAWPKARRG